MKKFILPIGILIFSLAFVSSQVFAQQDAGSHKLTCDEVWKIVGTEDCPDWAVNTDLGGVWCNITSLDRTPWTAGKAPTYTFTPGTCSVAEADQPPAEPAAAPKAQRLKSFILVGTSIGNWMKKNFFGGSMPQVESLLTNAPADTDLGPAAPPAESKTREKPLTGTINEIDGNIDMRLADGTWVPLENGNFIPEGATIFAGYDSTAHLKFSNFLEIYLRSLDEVNLKILQNDPEKYKTELKLEDGSLRFKVLEPTMKTDMRVSTPNTTASIVGTDFGVAYYKESGLSVWEIYDGTIEVENTHTGEKKMLASRYGSPVRRLEARNDSPMVEKIAIPKNQKGTKLPFWISIGGVAVLVVGALLFTGRKRVIKGQHKKRL